ncbi:putative nitrogen assimilation transcription factor nirA [Rosellinia necatrix]|uniref:Putative nitrogen assimilation transcription factor nirA n=1 Tax=Rosellinia necatrix TaxID=77044 RepID=A0A1W2TJ78_ROSNE|nr:putative nitrogen assimilation transcription factor nirA [Rosellinia necatrix]
MTEMGSESPAEESSSALPTAAPNRRYGFACYNCRRRKVKCDGALPTCQKCLATHNRCTYNKRPSVAYAITLQRQLKTYQSLFEQLRTASYAERDAILAKPLPLGVDEPHVLDGPGPPRDIGNSSSPWSDGETEVASLQKETSIDVDGKVCFYGSTSLYHVAPSDNHQGESEPSDGGDTQAGDTPVEFERNNKMAAFLGEIPPALLDELLDEYWRWPHHLHRVLVKKIFKRSLQEPDSYISPFLLSAVLTQAARYSTRPDAAGIGRHFAKRALELLPHDIDKGSSIAAIQGLLIFSARECVCGRTSQGWLYSGMAFRMARDMGLHVAPSKLGPLLIAYCKLCIVIHEVLDRIYTSPQPAEKDRPSAPYLDHTLAKLDQWSARFANDLLVREDSKVMNCPPLHMLVLNLVYQAVVILLCRPYRAVSATARGRCTRAAQMTDTLFMLHIRRFGFKHITWQHSYAVFVACTINVMDMSERKPGGADAGADPDLAQAARARLDFGLEVLRQGVNSTPSARRCALVIGQLMQNRNEMGPMAQRVSERKKPSPPPGEEHRDRTIGASALHSQPAALLPITGECPPTMRPGETGENLANMPTDAEAEWISLEWTANSIYAGEASRLIQSRDLDNGEAADVDMSASMAHPPFRWLSDNIWHDGSWMLTNVEPNQGA